jgi:tetratricopeptide (TPR) repeat protein
VRTAVVLGLFALLLLRPAGAAGQDTFARAKALYSSAAYDDALALLDAITTDTADPLGMEVEKYRAFCLFALQRIEDATRVIERMVSADPSYRVVEVQAAPRVYRFFQEVRRAVLPAVVQRLYAEARAAFDHGDPRATAQFDRVLSLLEDPDVQGATPADFRVLVTGFRDLSRARAQMPAPSPAATPATDVARAETDAPVEAPSAAVRDASTETAAARVPPPSSRAPSEDAAIATTLRAYEDAYSSLDVEATRAVFPTVNAALLAQGFAQMKAQRLQILEAQFVVSGTTATVTCRVRQRFEPKVGRASETTVSTTFFLQKSNGVWSIVDRR